MAAQNVYAGTESKMNLKVMWNDENTQAINIKLYEQIRKLKTLREKSTCYRNVFS